MGACMKTELGSGQPNYADTRLEIELPGAANKLSNGTKSAFPCQRSRYTSRLTVPLNAPPDGERLPLMSQGESGRPDVSESCKYSTATVGTGTELGIVV